MKFSNNEPERADFQIAPMIDIVFLLLIFFIVTWDISNQRQEPNKEIDLPTSEEGRTINSYDHATVIDVFQDGRIMIGEKAYTKDSIKSQMEQTHRLFPDKPITIRADKDATIDQAFSIFNICKAQGFEKVTIAADPSTQ